jgi:hypothetical protein
MTGRPDFLRLPDLASDRAAARLGFRLDGGGRVPAVPAHTAGLG